MSLVQRITSTINESKNLCNGFTLRTKLPHPIIGALAIHTSDPITRAGATLVTDDRANKSAIISPLEGTEQNGRANMICVACGGNDGGTSRQGDERPFFTATPHYRE
ncbi:hypothetical protein ACJJTC_018640 [Scirpophaga incertulas]